MEKLITIVIPTYNMEKYLDKCLTSLIVLDEYMEQMEVLVVNDGSKDNSSAIAHQYENKYPQTFRVIDKENGNYGSCVNRGLKEATGKFIKILDADDYISNENICSFLNKLSQIDSDMVLTPFDKVDEEGCVLHVYNYDLKEDEKYAFSAICTKPTILDIGIHGVIFKTELLKEHQYKQTEGISYTDQEWVSIPMSYMKTVSFVNTSLTHYLIGREGQTMDTNVMCRNIQQLMTVVLSLVNNYNDCLSSDKSIQQYLLHKIYLQLAYIYDWGILRHHFDDKLMKKFDKQLYKYNDKIHKHLESFCFGGRHKVYYVHIWRKGGKMRLFYLRAIYGLQLMFMKIRSLK